MDVESAMAEAMAENNMPAKRPLKKQSSLLGDNFNTNSLLCSMNSFVDAVDKMDKTVMLPSRLMDCQQQDISPVGNGSNGTNGLNGKNGTNGTNGHNGNGDTKTTGANGKNGGNGYCKSANVDTSTDLYSFYSLLKCLKHELVEGEPSEEEEEDDYLGIDTDQDSGKAESVAEFYISENDDEEEEEESDDDREEFQLNTPTLPPVQQRQNEQTVKVVETFRYHMHEMRKLLQQLATGAEHLELLYTTDMNSTVPVDKFGVKLDSSRLPGDMSSNHLSFTV